MKTLISAGVLALLATSAMAEDWTGGYIGGGLGYADVNLSAGLAGGNNGTMGLHAGYNYDYGEWVIGGEVEYDWTSIGLAGGVTTLDNLTRLKFKLGYDFGPTLVYAVAGGAWAYTDNRGDDSGWLAGVGLGYEVNPRWMISGEVLYHDFSNFNGTGVDVDATSFNLRASYRF